MNGHQAICTTKMFVSATRFENAVLGTKPNAKQKGWLIMQWNNTQSCPNCYRDRPAFVWYCQFCGWIQRDPHTGCASRAALPKPAPLPNPDDHPFIKYLDKTLVLP